MHSINSKTRVLRASMSGAAIWQITLATLTSPLASFFLTKPIS